ncbi:MAG: hypothetical protein CSA22_05720 [Deltaproteobacteria bacterium]|nr:MAG: hypothetical protein CSA22_05720 [Deltaproteobacteria bacterium]
MFGIHIPALIRLLAVFVLILFLIRKKVSLGNTFFIGTVCMGLVFGLGPLAIGKSVLTSCTHVKTLALTAIVVLILILSSSLDRSGQMRVMLDAFKGLIRSPRLNLVLFPSLIGLLPMPGGAIFSAPMVKELGARSGYSPARLSYVNYWFRHVWEFWWPLYPGVLLTTTLAGIDIIRFMGFMFPLSILALGVGFVFLKADTPPEQRDDAAAPSRQPVRFLISLVPVLIVIIGGLGTGFFLSAIFSDWMIAKEVGLILSLLVSIAFVWIRTGMDKNACREMLFNRNLMNMIYMILTILMFKEVLEQGDAVTAVTGDLLHLHIPVAAIVMILPFLVGVVTGITIAFVGSTFPILIPLIQAMDPGAALMPYMMLGLSIGFVGVLVSPVHLCFILTNEYFRVDTATVYAVLVKPALGLGAMALVYYAVLRAII